MTSSEQLVDQEARNAITGELDRTLFVEAGAGTGKTRSLVERVVRLLATGRATAPGVAAITFTEAAAAELRDRLRGALEVLVADEEADPAERERCEQALTDLDSAAVETIHAFCRRLLSAFPLEAGLPPGFELVTGPEADAEFGEQWDAWFAAYLERAARDEVVATPLLRVLALGGDEQSLRAVAFTLRGHWDRLAATDEPVAQVEIEPGELAARLRAMSAERERCSDPADTMVVHLDRLPAMADRLEQATDDLALVDALRPVAERVPGTAWLFGRTGTGKNWPAGGLNDLRAELLELHGEAGTLLAEMGSAALAEVTREIARFVLDAAVERRRSGRLEFQDLLVIARDLLATQPEVRAAVRERYTHLFIDEFQDTDPLQAEIAFLIGSSGPADAVTSMDGDTTDEGRLFFVGDPKQSIYRFRRADIDIYRRVQRGFESRTVRLTQNFRSVPGVIDLINAQFEERFTAHDADRQATHIPLAAARTAIADGPAAHWMGGGRGENMPVIRAEEAEDIAALLRSIQRGGWLVRDGDGSRVAELEDVAILSRARTGLLGLIDVLEEAGIPHRVESRTTVYEAQEVRDLISILRAIDDPTDAVSLVAALRSAAFACGDDDLVRYHAVGGVWDIRPAPPATLPGDDPVVEAMRWFRAQHERRWWISLTQLVDDVIAERRLFELAFVDRRPRERWQRLRFVAEQARMHAERPEATLRSLIDWLEWQASERTQVQERVVPEPDDNAVRLMTIHAAKGLQFPIVIVVGLGAPRRKHTEPVAWGADGAPEAHVSKALRTAGYEAAQTEDELLDNLERQRLLYVAMTRAEDHLVLSCYYKERSAKSTQEPSAAEEIAAFAVENPALCHEIDVEALRSAPAPAERASDEATGTEDSMDRGAWIEARRALVDSHRPRRAVSATTLAREHALMRAAPVGVETDAGLEKDEPLDEMPPWRRGRAGTSIGRAVHSVLQTVDLDTGADLEAIAEAQSTAEGVPDRAAEVARLARAALESDAVREAVERGRYWREVYVATEIEGVVVDGFIDLLYETDAGYVVVDYKTDSVGAGRLDELLERYRPQALAYALVLSEQLARPVLRCDFVFVSAPGGAAVGTVEVDAAALEGLRAAVAAR